AQAKDGIALRYDGFLTSAEDLKNLVVANIKDRPVLLRDVAEVSDGASSERTVVSRWAPGQSSPDLALTQGRDLSSVTFAVAKKKGVNAVTAVDAMLERIERMQAQFLPEGVKLTITRNDGDKANDAVNTVIEHIGVSVVAVFVITWLFLGLRSACIMGITIPLILAMTLFVNEFAGLTINRVTLFGFVIALGLLVDDSIVVIENIERHYSANPTGNRSYLAALSVAEIGYPTMLATFTVMIVFYTLIPTLTGMPKQYFFPIGFMVPAAVFSSLIIAYSVAPWLAVRFLKTKPKQTPSKTNAPELSRLGRFYHKTASYVIGRKWPTVGVFVLIAILMTGAILQPAWQFIRPQGVAGDLSFFGVEMGFLPKDNKNTFNVTIKLADGTPLEVTDRAVRDVAAIAKTIPEAVDILSWSGDSGVPDFTALFRGSIAKGSNIGAVRVNLTNKATGRRSSIDIARQLREDLKPVAARYPDSTIQVVEDPPGPPQRASVLAEIYGYDTDRLRPLAAQVREEFRQTWDMVETMTYESTDVRQARFEVDQEKAALAGVLPAQVTLALRRLTAGETVGYVHVPGERQAQPIVLRADYADKIDPENLAGLTVKNIQGKDVALSELVRVVEKHAEHNLMHKDGTPVIMVGGELGNSVPAYAVLDLDRRLNGMSAGNGLSLVTGNLGLKAVRADLSSAPVQLLWDGEIRMMLDAYHDLFIALAIAVITIFLVLVGYYRSFVLPVIVMSAIPVCFIGIMPGHWLTGQIFSATSLIGLVTLAGVLVRNSLLLSDFVVDYLKMGLPLKEAVLDAGAV
ncbi:MAG: efflux RND transporter permease subunit, partial [Sutterellaceae bacterium]|nr:efflux RND transporter permease subunit [Sutterellaceae bacterium]